MLIDDFVVTLGPLQYFLHLLCEGEVPVRYEGLRVAWNVKAIELLQLVLHFLDIHVKVNWYDSGSSTFQELDNGSLNKLFCGERINNLVGMLGQPFSPAPFSLLNPLKLIMPLAFPRNWLSQYSNNWILSLFTHVVTSADHGRVLHCVMHALRIIKVLFAVY